MNSSRGKIVISAFSCGPKCGSEAEVGWQVVNALRKHFEALVFVDSGYEKHFSAELLSCLSDDGIELHFRKALNLPQRFLDGGSVFRSFYYLLWQLRLPGWVNKELNSRKPFLAHHVTWAKYSFPTFLGRLQCPYLIGPVGGAESAPGSLLVLLSKKQRFVENVREMSKCFARASPLVRKVYREADLVWASTRETECEVLRLGAPKVRIRSQVSVENVVGQLPSQSGVVVTSGRLIGWKGFRLVIEAFFKASDDVKKLIVLGDGPEMSVLEELARDLARPGKGVEFRGWVEMDEAKKVISEARCFCFGSLHDSGGFVVLEALSFGVPVVCLNSGGPGQLVDESCGFAIEPSDPDITVEKMATALSKVYGDEVLAETLRRGALRRAKDFTKETRAEELLETYREVLASGRNFETESGFLKS